MEENNQQFNNGPQINPVNLSPNPVSPAKKEKSILIPLISAIVLTAIIVGGSMYWWMGLKADRCIPLGYILESPASLPETAQADKPNWKIYQNDLFKVGYPADVFAVLNLSNGVSLMSDIFVIENSKGVGEGNVETFSINFYTGGSILEEIKKSPASFLFSDTFPNGTVESFNAGINNGFIKNFSASGHDGFMFTSGLEGTYTDYYFLPVNSSTSLVVEFNYITDFLKMLSQESQLRAQISGQEQKEIFTSVISTLQFLK